MLSTTLAAAPGGVAAGSSGDALLVALGAVPGAWLRFLLVNHLEPWLPRRHWGTVCVNLSACFGMGLLVALVGRGGDPHGRWQLLLGTGFLGSLSTFSTLLLELQAALRLGLRRESLLLGGGSVLGGLLALAAGRALGG